MKKIFKKFLFLSLVFGVLSTVNVYASEIYEVNTTVKNGVLNNFNYFVVDFKLKNDNESVSTKVYGIPSITLKVNSIVSSPSYLFYNEDLYIENNGITSSDIEINVDGLSFVVYDKFANKEYLTTYDSMRFKYDGNYWFNIASTEYIEGYSAGKLLGVLNGENKALSDIKSNVRWTGEILTIDNSKLPMNYNTDYLVGYNNGYEDGYRSQYFTVYLEKYTPNTSKPSVDSNTSIDTTLTDEEKEIIAMQEKLNEYGQEDGKYYGEILGRKFAIYDYEQGEPIDMNITAKYLVAQIPNENIESYNDNYLAGLSSTIYGSFYDVYISTYKQLKAGTVTVDQVKYLDMTQYQKELYDKEQEEIKKAEEEAKKREEELKKQHEEELKKQEETENLINKYVNSIELKPSGFESFVDTMKISSKQGIVFFNQTITGNMISRKVKTNGIQASNLYTLVGNKIDLYEELDFSLPYYSKKLPMIYYSIDGLNYNFVSSSLVGNELQFSIGLDVLNYLEIVVVAHDKYNVNDLDNWIVGYVAQDICDIKYIDVSKLNGNVTYAEYLDIISDLNKSENVNWISVPLNYSNLNNLSNEQVKGAKIATQLNLNPVKLGGTADLNKILKYSDLKKLNVLTNINDSMKEMVWCGNVSKLLLYGENAEISKKEVLYFILKNKKEIDGLSFYSLYNQVNVK